MKNKMELIIGKKEHSIVCNVFGNQQIQYISHVERNCFRFQQQQNKIHQDINKQDKKYYTSTKSNKLQHPYINTYKGNKCNEKERTIFTLKPVKTTAIIKIILYIISTLEMISLSVQNIFWHLIAIRSKRTNIKNNIFKFNTPYKMLYSPVCSTKLCTLYFLTTLVILPKTMAVAASSTAIFNASTSGTVDNLNTSQNMSAAGNNWVASTIATSSPPPMYEHAAAFFSSSNTGGGATSFNVASSTILEQFSPNCSAVAHMFQSSGIDVTEIPTKPNVEMVLRYCESQSVGTCCTYTMESKMAKQSRTQLEKHLKEQIMKMSSVLGTKAVKFNDVFRKLLLDSKMEFHNMFTRTYGVIYQQNAYVFSDLFNELENYFANGRVDLMEVMEKFFNTLYQKMFTVLNSQYSFNQDYLQCVSEHMKELKPFGDVPDKLSIQIKRSFVATRTYAQALATAADVSKKLINIRLNADCTGALTKLQHCGTCKGYTEKPCSSYCVNVMKGCLHFINEFNLEWENFASAMDKVAERLLGSFNIVMVVEPINIKISEAIMNFQDAGQDITNRVFQGCGRPLLGRSKRAIRYRLSEDNKMLSSRYIHTHANAIYVKEKSNFHNYDSPTSAHTDDDILDIDEGLDDRIVVREKRASLSNEDIEYNDDSDHSETVYVDESAVAGNLGRGQKRKQQQRQHEIENDYTNRDPILDKMVRDIRQRVKDTKKFWSNLPHDICSNEEIATSTDVDGMCWNGHTIDRYMHSVTTEHVSNPEFPGNPTTARQTAQVSTQLYFLKNAINHLRNAYNGQDVDWTDQEELYYNSGSGSGDGSPDDEDDDEGSGLGGTELAPSYKPTIDEHNFDNSNNEDDEDDLQKNTDNKNTNTNPKNVHADVTNRGSDVNGDNGGTAHDRNQLNEHDNDDDYMEPGRDKDISKTDNGATATAAETKMSLRRALLLYLLPIYVAWFGSIITDLL